MLTVVKSTGHPQKLCKYCFFRYNDCSKRCDKTATDVKRLKNKSTLFYEGDQFNGYIVILSGAVRITKYLADGRRIVIGFFYPGDVIGLSTKGRSYTAEAITDVEYASFGMDHLSNEITKSPEVASRFLSFICNELENSKDQMMVLARKSPVAKISHFLLQHAERMGTRDKGFVSLQMSRGDIADHLGMTIETVCRALKKLKDTRIIRIDQVKNIHLLNMNALTGYAEGDEELPTAA